MEAGRLTTARVCVSASAGGADGVQRVMCKSAVRSLLENLLLELCLKGNYFLHLDHKMCKIYNVPEVGYMVQKIIFMGNCTLKTRWELVSCLL